MERRQFLSSVGAVALAHLHKSVVPHHGGGQLGTIAQLHLTGTWPHCPWIEILHDPPVAAYMNSFAIFNNPPKVDHLGFMAMPQEPGLGVTLNRDLIIPD